MMQIFSSYDPQGKSTTFCEYHNKQSLKDSIDMSTFDYLLSLDFLFLNVLSVEYDQTKSNDNTNKPFVF